MPHGLGKQIHHPKGGDAILRHTEADADALVRMLYDIAEDAEAPAASRLSAIKEILDRTVGKGTLLIPDENASEQPFRVEIEVVDSDCS